MVIPRDSPEWWWPADWPAPRAVRAGMTTRRGGHSAAPFQGFNLAMHVGDQPAAVAANRAELREGLRLPAEPCWLQQVHGNRVVSVTDESTAREADGSHAAAPGAVCTVLVADCVPLLLTDSTGTEVAAIHAGWRGIAAGIVAAGLKAMAAVPGDVLAWIGPCIAPGRYEVGAEVRAACLRADPGAGACFHPTMPGRWQADLAGLVRRQLARAGVCAVHGGGVCVYQRSDLFFSHRRDGRTGRMAALVWIDPDQSRAPAPRPDLRQA